jgi:hypothetical protein
MEVEPGQDDVGAPLGVPAREYIAAVTALKL